MHTRAEGKITSCPKCGERSNIICDIEYEDEKVIIVNKRYAIYCNRCNHHTRYYKKYERAVSAWNKRESITRK